MGELTSPRTRVKHRKPEKHIFVVMPLSETPKRRRKHLTAFFENNIRKPIEKAKLAAKYVVTRSDDDFDINEQIVKDLYNADVVICDLSGIVPNANVMYELGLRLGLTSNPVVLIREKNRNNQRIFDIAGFYEFLYDPKSYDELTTWLISKIRELETPVDAFSSPILRVLGDEVPLVKRISRSRALFLLGNLGHCMGMSCGIVAGTLEAGILTETGEKVDIGKFFADKNTAGLIIRLQSFEHLYIKDLGLHLPATPPLEEFIAAPFLHGVVSEEIERAFLDACTALYYRHWQLSVVVPELTFQVSDLISLLKDLHKFGAVVDALTECISSGDRIKAAGLESSYWTAIESFRESANESGIQL